MANLVIEITVPVTSDDVIEQAAMLAGFNNALTDLKAELPEGSQCTSRLIKTRARDAKPSGRKPKAVAENGTESRAQTST